MAAVPPSLLRYADEQTVAGTAAVFTAIEAMATPASVSIIGELSRVALPGSRNLAVALCSFMAEGCGGHRRI